MDLRLPNEEVDRAVADGVLLALDRHVQMVGARGRVVADVGPFRAFFSRRVSTPAMSLAVPREAETGVDWNAGFKRLVSAFAEQRGAVRVDCFAERHPALAGALAAQGVDAVVAQAVMYATPAVLIAPQARPAAGIHHLRCDDDQGLLKDLMTLQALCAENPVSFACQRDWLAQFRQDMASGLATACVAIADGIVVGGALLVEGGDAAEISGVVTHPAWRRRRIATGLCSRLLADRFVGGRTGPPRPIRRVPLIWLCVGSPPAYSLYSRLGFRHAGTRLSISVGIPENS